MEHGRASGKESWDILDRRLTFQDRWLRIFSDRVRLPNDTVLDPFHVFEAASNVSVISLTADQEVILVRQWRHPVQRVTLEFPAGGIEQGEEPLAAAKRELLEETGFTSDEWHLLGTCDEYPSRQNNQLSSFLALNCTKVAAQNLSRGELISVQLLPWQEFRRQLGSGERTMGAMHYAALVWLDHYYARGVAR